MLWSNVKSGSVAIKGQFTVLKATLEDLSNIVEKILESFFHFLLFCIPQQRVLSAPEAQRRVCMG